MNGNPPEPGPRPPATGRAAAYPTPSADTRGASAVNRYFDERAASWDEDPARTARTAAIAAAVKAMVPLHPGMRVLDYGCGTGALGALLAGSVGQVVAADASPGMVEQVRRKVAAGTVRNLVPRLLDLTRDPLPRERFELVVSAMALHHIEDIDRLLGRLAELLAPGGWMALADLLPEDGSFHTGIAVPHHGIDPDRLGQRLAALGLEPRRSRTVCSIARGAREYPVFLLVAVRPGREPAPSPGQAPGT